MEYYLLQWATKSYHGLSTSKAAILSQKNCPNFSCDLHFSNVYLHGYRIREYVARSSWYWKFSLLWNIPRVAGILHYSRNANQCDLCRSRCEICSNWKSCRLKRGYSNSSGAKIENYCSQSRASTSNITNYKRIGKNWLFGSDIEHNRSRSAYFRAYIWTLCIQFLSVLSGRNFEMSRVLLTPISSVVRVSDSKVYSSKPRNLFKNKIPAQVEFISWGRLTRRSEICAIRETRLCNRNLAWWSWSQLKVGSRKYQFDWF